MHTHTYFSDGRLSPEDLVEKATSNGLEGLVVTDHDNYEAYESFKQAAHGKLETIPGMEISTSYNNRELHLLSYAFKTDDETLKDYTIKYKEKRKNRAEQMVHKLRGQGFDLDISRLDELVKHGVHGRPHIAQMLLEKEYVSTIKEAFDNYLTYGKKGFVPTSHIDTVEAIKMVKKAGGVTIIAHPGKHTQQKTIHRLLHKGLDGIEYVHPSHDIVMSAKYKGLIDNYWMLGSGGSDYHGTKAKDEDNIGKFTVPMDKLFAIKKKGRA
jgi:predicted metal-dependent phosphoesterase TrpH